MQRVAAFCEKGAPAIENADLTYIEVWKELLAADTIPKLETGDFQELTRTLEKDVLMAVLEECYDKVLELLERVDDFEEDEDRQSTLPALQPAAKSSPPPDRTVMDNVISFCSNGKKKSNSIPTEHLRYVEVWGEMFRTDTAMSWTDGELEELSRIMTKEEAMAVVRASLGKVCELMGREKRLESTESEAAYARRMDVQRVRMETLRQMNEQMHNFRMNSLSKMMNDSAKRVEAVALTMELNSRTVDSFEIGTIYKYEVPSSTLRQRLNDL